MHAFQRSKNVVKSERGKKRQEIDSESSSMGKEKDIHEKCRNRQKTKKQ